MFSPLTWTIAAGGGFEVRAARGRVSIYADGTAARRLALGVDEAGVPVCAVPFLDRGMFSAVSWATAIFAVQPHLPIDVARGLGDTAGHDRIGLIGREEGRHVALWLPANPNLLGAILHTAEKFGGASALGRLRLACHGTDRAGATVWMCDEDIALLTLRSEPGELLDHTIAWPEAKQRGGKRRAAG